MEAIKTARDFFDACEMRFAGWAGCKPYVEDNATFHSAAGSYSNIRTIEAYCQQIQGAFTTTFAGSTGEVHAVAYDPEQHVVLLYGDSLAQHTGDGGPVPATFQKAKIPFVFALSIGETGKIKHLEKIYDEASGRVQMGWPQLAQAA